MTVTEQWMWRMDWCKRRGLAPANSAIWELSGKELAKHIGCIFNYPHAPSNIDIENIKVSNPNLT